MECICIMKDIYKAINEFEEQFHNEFGICLNEGLILCSLKEHGRMSSTEIAEQCGMKCSHTSKMIKSIEDKGYIARSIGSEDKRNMNFELTKNGLKILQKMNAHPLEIPELLRPVFKCSQTVNE